VNGSRTLAEIFPKLKSLIVELTYYAPDGVSRSSQIKYKVNLNNAKSVFRFDCVNKECIRGDFDLSEVLSKAVAAQRTSAVGEMRCNGWRKKETIRTAYCWNVLHYKLSLGY
jgi:hypothetical protein